jgi:nucleolar protein 56
MDREISSHEKFVKLIAKFGSRDAIEDEKLERFKQKSMGIDFDKEDVKAVQKFPTQISELYKLRESLSKYLEKLVREIAPNFTEIAGPTLTAKFIARAGSLEKLAKMPSSTIQLLGAEKALFRYLRGRGKPPKHGILYSHSLIQSAPKKFRGKIARVLASKLNMAAKIDFYSKEYKADDLKKDLEQKIKEVLSK